MRRVKEEDHELIRNAYDAGFSYEKIGKIFGVGKRCIFEIVNPSKRRPLKPIIYSEDTVRKIKALRHFLKLLN